MIRLWLFIAAVVLVILDVCLLLSGYRVLVYEHLARPGERYVVPGWGDLGKSQQASFACTYWTGRSIKYQVFWYSPGNVMGKDECPMLLAPE